MKLTKDYLLGLIEGYKRAIIYIDGIFGKSENIAVKAEAQATIARLEAFKAQYEIYLAKHFESTSIYEDFDDEFVSIGQA